MFVAECEDLIWPVAFGQEYHLVSIEFQANKRRWRFDFNFILCLDEVLIYFYGYVNYKRFGKLGFSSVVIRGQIRFGPAYFYYAIWRMLYFCV